MALARAAVQSDPLGRPPQHEPLRGADWRDPILQAKYDGWFSPYLLKRIAALPTH